MSKSKSEKFAGVPGTGKAKAMLEKSCVPTSSSDPDMTHKAVDLVGKYVGQSKPNLDLDKARGGFLTLNDE